jgi:hypothetical protein
MDRRDNEAVGNIATTKKPRLALRTRRFGPRMARYRSKFMQMVGVLTLIAAPTTASRMHRASLKAAEVTVISPATTRSPSRL